MSLHVRQEPLTPYANVLSSEATGPRHRQAIGAGLVYPEKHTEGQSSFCVCGCQAVSGTPFLCYLVILYYLENFGAVEFCKQDLCQVLRR